VKVLDTDVCIEILRGNPVVIKRRAAVRDEIVTTWITASELCYGATKSSKPDNNLQLVTEFLATLPVVGIDLRAAARFGELKHLLERSGLRVADADLFIASISLAHAAEIVTGNRRHYQRIPGLRIEDWIRET
jgi:tRNA(fMet)-specific endonuclease VapC